MTAFWGLMKKEWILGRSVFIWTLILQVVVCLLTFFAARYFEYAGIFYIVGWSIMSLHAFMLISFLMTLLNIEGKSQLWLHNPQPAGILLGSKLLQSLLLSIYSVLFSSFLLFISLRIPPSFFHQDIRLDVSLGFIPWLTMVITIISMGLVLGIAALFLWTLYHSLKRVRFVKNVRWLVVSLAIIGFIGINALWESTSIYKRINEMWMIKINGWSFNMSEQGLEFHISSGEVSLISVGLNMVMLGLLFMASCWLMDRRIEV